jgi:hypothetical protein
MGDLARAVQKVHKIAENAEYGNVKSEFYGIIADTKGRYETHPSPVTLNPFVIIL